MTIPKTLTKFIWFFVKQQPVAFAYIFVTSWVWAVNESVFPYFIKLIVDTLAHHQGDPTQIYADLMWPLIGIAILWLMMEFSMRTQGFVILYAFPRLRANIRETVFGYVRQHSHEYFSNHFAGSIANKIADLPSSSERILEIFIHTFSSILTAFIVALFLLWNTNPIFFAIMFAWACLHIGISLLFLRKGNRLAKIHSEATSALSGKVVDTFGNILNVRLFARGAYESTYLAKFQRDEVEKAKQALMQLEIMKLFLGFFSLALIFATIYTLLYGWSHGWVTLGDFTLVSMLTFNMLGLIWFMSSQITVYVREAGRINAALNLISVEHGIKDRPQAKPLKVKFGALEFDNVCFSYHRNATVFDHLSVTISAGEKVGLVGISGSGKSTFVNLSLRFYDIQSGKILIDQQDIADITRDSLRQAIAMIPQEPSLFHRTLMENIRYGRLDATNEEVIKAAKLAHCDEFINQLEEGYDTLVGERGIKLSGGQRQRIAIARAMLKDAPILILDEATSALDSITEKLIQDSLKELMQNRTTLVVAHRLSTLANMDRIIVFEQGKIIESGNFDELLIENGTFAKLWRQQSDGLLPEELSG